MLAPHCAALDSAAARVLRRGDAGSVHRLRVALSRTRATLALFAEVLPSPTVIAFDGELRGLRHALATTREWDLLLKPGIWHAVEPGAAAEALRSEAAARRKLALRAGRLAVHEAIDHRLPERLLSLAAALALAPTRRKAEAVPTVPVLLARRLSACRGQLARRGRHAARLGPRRLHRLRLSAKRLRYTLELGVLQGDACDDEIKALRALEGVLGAIQDQCTVQRLAADLGTDADAAAAAVAADLAAAAAGARRHQQRKLAKAWKRVRRSL